MKRMVTLGVLWMMGALLCGQEQQIVTQSVSAVDGMIQLEKNLVVLFQDGFVRPAPEKWQAPKSYENHIQFEYGMRENVPGLVVYHDGPNVDTAWELISRPQALPDRCKSWQLQLHASSVAPLHIVNGVGAQWCSCLNWYDGEGRLLMRSKIGFEYYSPDRHEKALVQVNVNQGSIPAGARRVTISLGMDLPNLYNGDFIVLNRIALSVDSIDDTYVREGRYLSAMVPYQGGHLSWSGDLPSGCGLAFQLSFAPDLDGKPGRWSEFCGPDGSVKTFYRESNTQMRAPQGSQWVRYLAILTSTGSRTPRLKSVSLGTVRDEAWESLHDIAGPKVCLTSATPSDKVHVPVEFLVKDRNPVNWKTLKILDSQGKEVTSWFTRQGARLSYRPGSPWKAGLHSFRISVSDVLGNRTSVTRYFFIGPPAVKGIVSMRDDGFLLVDGKPFFPIFMFGVHPCKHNGNDLDQGMRELAAHGFNVAHTYRSGMSDTRAFLAAARRHGLKAIVSGPPDCNTKNIESYLKSVVLHRQSEAVLAWNVGDDTRYFCKPDELSERCLAIKAVDPFHLTTQADGVGTPNNPFYLPFVACTDSFLAVNYPIGDKSMATAEKAIPLIIQGMKLVHDNVRQAGVSQRSLWACLQYFKGWGWKDFPTASQLRAMSWASIIHGAHGISWYTYAHWKESGATATPETWRNMTQLSREIAELSEVILQRTGRQLPPARIVSGPARDVLGYPSITMLLKEHEGKQYLFTVNSTMRPVRASFQISGARLAKVLSEKRVLAVNNGCLTDDFKPNDVHLYVWEKKGDN